MAVFTDYSSILLALLTSVICVWYFKPNASLSHISGPRRSSWLLGSQAWLSQAPAGLMDAECRAQFGDVYRYDGCFGTEWLMISDPKAMSHVLRGQTTTYRLEPSLREFVRLVAGKGLVYSDGPSHGHQKRIMAPAFHLTSLKRLMPVFYDCGNRLVRQLKDDIKHKSDGIWSVINTPQWMTRLTLDAIGEGSAAAAGFGYKFKTIEHREHTNELARAYEGMINTAFARPTAMTILLQSLVQMLPAWLISQADYLPVKRMTIIRRTRKVALRHARELVAQRKADALENAENQTFDLLSLLVRANMAEDPRIRMADEELYGQMTNFLTAGQESSANTMNFLLWELARRPDLQARLHTEISETFENTGDTAECLTYESLEKMAFTSAVVKEGLRVNPAIFNGMLQAATDNVIPLRTPILSRSGKQVHHIPVKKGQRVNLSFFGFNRLRDIWGNDADDFRPDRWLEQDLESPSADERCSGMFANLFDIFYFGALFPPNLIHGLSLRANFGGGPKGCIAWRFALIEIHIFLVILIREFEFTLADPSLVVRRDGCHAVMTPGIEGQLDRGIQLPLRIRVRE